MSSSLRILGVIPARGGSKGIPHKNMALLDGLPLLAYTLDVAKAAQKEGLITELVVSTDDSDIMQLSWDYGVLVACRVENLCLDTTPMLPVLVDALKAMLQRNVRMEDSAFGSHPPTTPFDAVLCLQPTSPLRQLKHIAEAVGIMERTGCDSVISVTPVGEHHPARMKSIDPEGRLIDPPFAEAVEGMRRQDLPPLYIRGGTIYLTRVKTLLAGSIKGQDSRALVIPSNETVNIDEPEDLWLAEQKLNALWLQKRMTSAPMP